MISEKAEHYKVTYIVTKKRETPQQAYIFRYLKYRMLKAIFYLSSSSLITKMEEA